MPNLIMGNFAKETAKLRFRSFNITLPAIPASYTGPTLGPGLQQTGLQTPFQGSNLAPVAGGASRLANFGTKPSAPGSGSSARSGAGSNPPATATPMPFPPALFRAASNSKDDVDQQRGMHDMFSALFDGIIDAIEYGFNQYRQTAGLMDVTIEVAIAAGGWLNGPPLDGLIKSAASVAGWNGWYAMARDAVAGGMEKQWSVLAKSVRVPGLPWYPAFVAYPGPYAPPTANVPSAFATLLHDANATSPANLANAMRFALRGNMDYSMEFFESVAVTFQAPLLQWKMAQQVMNVLGKGPCPGWAPPYMPVAPVYSGSTEPGAHIKS